MVRAQSNPTAASLSLRRGADTVFWAGRARVCRVACGVAEFVLKPCALLLCPTDSTSGAVNTPNVIRDMEVVAKDLDYQPHICSEFGSRITHLQAVDFLRKFFSGKCLLHVLFMAGHGRPEDGALALSGDDVLTFHDVVRVWKETRPLEIPKGACLSCSLRKRNELT
jgi:hypothetical protein